MSDLISRQAAINELRFRFDNTAKTWMEMRDLVIDALKEVPSAQKKGEWKREVLGSTSGYGTTVMYQCSECERMAISQYNYCPNCGADMRGK